MTTTLDDVDYLILRAVADDFEKFEMIVSEITKWTSNNKAGLDVSRIQQALMRAIAEGTVKAYEPHDGHHQLAATDVDPLNIHSLWFYITEQGNMRMQKLEEEAKRT